MDSRRPSHNAWNQRPAAVSTGHAPRPRLDTSDPPSQSLLAPAAMPPPTGGAPVARPRYQPRHRWMHPPPHRTLSSRHGRDLGQNQSRRFSNGGFYIVLCYVVRIAPAITPRRHRSVTPRHPAAPCAWRSSPHLSPRGSAPAKNSAGGFPTDGFPTGSTTRQ